MRDFKQKISIYKFTKVITFELTSVPGLDIQITFILKKSIYKRGLLIHIDRIQGAFGLCFAYMRNFKQKNFYVQIYKLTWGLLRYEITLRQVDLTWTWKKITKIKSLFTIYTLRCQHFDFVINTKSNVWFNAV